MDETYETYEDSERPVTKLKGKKLALQKRRETVNKEFLKDISDRRVSEAIEETQSLIEKEQGHRAGKRIAKNPKKKEEIIAIISKPYITEKDK